jgi:hypothetical protein
MSDIASGLPNERETSFVDPWSKKPNHQGVVPVDASLAGRWLISCIGALLPAGVAN